MNLEQGKLIYTLGTSTRSSEEFIELLSSHGVEVVVDVRRFPSSRLEHFRREKLAGLCSFIRLVTRDSLFVITKHTPLVIARHKVPKQSFACFPLSGIASLCSQ